MFVCLFVCSLLSTEMLFELHDRARYVYGEAGRVLKFQEMYKEGKPDLEETLGNLMNCSQDSMKKLFQCTVKEVDELVEVCR